MGSNRPVMSSASGGSGGWLAAEAVAGDRAQGPARGRQEPGPAVHDDHVQGDFTAQRPDPVWVTDITEHPTAEGKLSCCAIKDLFSSRIVGYAIDGRMTAHLAVTACARPSPAGDRRAL